MLLTMSNDKVVKTIANNIILNWGILPGERNRALSQLSSIV